MAVTETRSIITDFSGSIPNIGQLGDIIVADPAISTAVFKRITISGDVVKIKFDVALLSGELTALNNLITTFSNTPIYSRISIGMNECSTESTDYVVLYTYIFPGEDEVGNVTEIKAVGRIDSGATNYSVKFVDITNVAVISETTFTNTVDQIITLTTPSNISTTEAIWELQLKKSGGTTESAHIKSMELGISS